jgi:hypothetical protein
MPDVVEQSAANLVALRPAPGEKILEIERRSRLQGQSTTMRQSVCLDPFGDCPVANSDLGGDGDEGLARSVQLFSLREQELPRVAPRAAECRLTVAWGRRKSGTAGKRLSAVICRSMLSRKFCSR